MGLLDQLNEVLVQTPRKYWGDKATRLASLLSDSAAMYGSANSPMAPEHANTLAGLLADFTPGVGDVKSVYEGLQSAREGDYLGAALGGLGALPLVPNMAGVTVKRLKEYDPPLNVFGNMTRAEAKELLKKTRNGEMRLIVDPKTKQMHGWDAYRATHEPVGVDLGYDYNTLFDATKGGEGLGFLRSAEDIDNYPKGYFLGD